MIDISKKIINKKMLNVKKREKNKLYFILLIGDKMFTKKIDEKIRLLFLILVFFLIFIIVRVLYIQLFNYKMLNEKANDLWSRNLPIAADRGLILDRNGIILADNITTTSLVLIPSQLENKEEISKNLSTILGVSKEEMDKHIYKEVSIERVHPEGRRLSYEIANQINELNYKGVYLVKESKNTVYGIKRIIGLNFNDDSVKNSIRHGKIVNITNSGNAFVSDEKNTYFVNKKYNIRINYWLLI